MTLTAAAVLTASLLAPAGSATAQQDMDGLGGQVYSTGDPIIVTVLPSTAGITSSLHLFEPAPERYIATNREQGREITLPAVPAGTELVFGIRAQGNEFRTGPAERNPDGQVHARVTTEPGRVVIGFEDLFGGGDRDYDDNLFSFRGGISDKPVETDNPVRPKTIDIVHVGDSYSAGNGASDFFGKRSYYGPAGCYRSGDSWGWKFSDYLETRGHDVHYNNVACSGGVLDDYRWDLRMETDRFSVIIEGRYDPSRLQEVQDEAEETVLQCIPRIPEYNLVAVTGSERVLGTQKTRVFGTCTRYQPAQYNQVNEGTDLVVMTGGGNDLHFGALVQNCLVLMQSHLCREQIGKARALMDRTKSGNIYDELVNSLFNLSTRVASHARVAYVGYPLLEQDEDFTLKSKIYPSGPLLPGITVDTYRAGQEIRALGRAGDALQLEAIAAVNDEVKEKFGPNFITFVPVAEQGPDSFAGHEPLASGSNPARHIHEAGETKIKMEWYHPNFDGHNTYSGLVGRASDSTGLFGVKPNKPGNVDVLLAVDNTATMSGAVASLAARWSQVASEIAGEAGSVRFALTTFRDDPAAPDASPGDYITRNDVPFTHDQAGIGTALAALRPEGGGGRNDAALSGMIDGMSGNSWRSGAKKVVMLLTDAPAHDPEPFGRGLTSDDVALAAYNLDPAEVFVVDTSPDGAATATGSALAQLAAASKGSTVRSTPQKAGQALSGLLADAARKPYPLVQVEGDAKIGEPVSFTSDGTFHPDGTISRYAWDLDGDGRSDRTTTDGTLTHTYTAAYDGVVALTVTDGSGRSSVATTPLVVSRDGDTIEAGDVCPDVYDPEQADTDNDGLGDWCETDPDELPDPDTYASEPVAADPDGDSRLEIATGPLTTNANRPGELSAAGDRDWIAIDALGGTLQVGLLGANADLDLVLTDRNGKILASSTETGAKSERVRTTVTEGRYYAVVLPRKQDGTVEKYRLEVTSPGR